MTAPDARDGLVKVADDIAQDGALCRTLLRQGVVLPLQGEALRDQPLMRFRVVVVCHGHPGGRGGWRSALIVSAGERFVAET